MTSSSSHPPHTYPLTHTLAHSTPPSPNTAKQNKTKQKQGGHGIACSRAISQPSTRCDLTALGLAIRKGLQHGCGSLAVSGGEGGEGARGRVWHPSCTPPCPPAHPPRTPRDHGGRPGVSGEASGRVFAKAPLLRPSRPPPWVRDTAWGGRRVVRMASGDEQIFRKKSRGKDETIACFLMFFESELLGIF